MIATIVLATLLILILGGQIVVGLLLGGLSAGAGRPKVHEVLIEDEGSPNKVAVLNVSGLIQGQTDSRGGGGMVAAIKEQLQEAASDPAVQGVILQINSPGGEVIAADRIHGLINDFQREADKPIVASMESIAASGGYYISAPCDWIVANELTITGSIGVILQTYNYRGLLDKIGVRPIVFKSGRFKDMLRGSKSEDEVLPEVERMVQDLIEQTFARFRSVVEEGRQAAQEDSQGASGRGLVDNWEEYTDGRILSGRQAYEYGFIDELGNLDTAKERVLALAGIDHANTVRYERPWGLQDLFPVLSASRHQTVEVDIGVDVPDLKPARLYYLSDAILQ